MRIMTDCRCSTCDTVSEHWINLDEIATLPCPVCENPTLVRMIGACHLDVIGMAANGEASSDAMTSSIDKWAKMREQKAKIEKRNIERHGTYD